MDENKVIEDVLRDIRREDNDYISACYDKQYNSMPPKEKIEEYYSCKRQRPDAERRQYALESYFRYPLINAENGYYKENDFIYFCNNKKSIKITADLLTSPSYYIKNDEKICKEKHIGIDIRNAFYKSVYTIGNCCPVWKNPGIGSNAINDNIWYKLDKCFKGMKKDDILSSKKIIENNLNRRKAEQIFQIFNVNKKQYQIIKGLYFQDYYNYKWNLRFKSPSPDELSSEYIIAIIKLILQRGYRITCKVTRNRYNIEDIDILKKLFSKVGLSADVCEPIYSNKKMINTI